MGYHQIRNTKRGYAFDEVSSAMQKAIRRGDARLAGYFAIELFESGFAEYVWRRLLIISAEDCAGLLTSELAALREAYLLINKQAKKGETKGRIFIAKAVILMCQWPKSRDADHLTNLIYDRKAIPDERIAAMLTEHDSGIKPKIPDYALDCHTLAGKIAGKTKKGFFAAEHDALFPREPGLFDADLEANR